LAFLFPLYPSETGQGGPLYLFETVLSRIKKTSLYRFFPNNRKMQKGRILIIDEAGFSRVCSAILEVEGYSSEVLSEADLLAQALEKDFRLVIASYPFGKMAFEHLKKMKIPTIILSDQINKELMKTLEGFNNSYCMIKPLDYEKFRSLIKDVLGNNLEGQNGFKII